MGRLAVRAPPTRNRGRNRALRGHLRLPVSGSFDRRGIRRPPAHPLPPPADRTRRSRPHMHDHPVNAPHIPHEPVTWVSRGGRGGAAWRRGETENRMGREGGGARVDGEERGAWKGRSRPGKWGDGATGRGRGRGGGGQGRPAARRRRGGPTAAGAGWPEVTSGRCACAWRGGVGRPWRGAAGPGRATPAPLSAPAGTAPAAVDARHRSPARRPAPHQPYAPPHRLPVLLRRRLAPCLRLSVLLCCGGSRCVFGCPCWSARRSRRVFGSPQRPAGRPRSPTGRLRCPIAGARRPAALLRRTVCRPGCPAARTCRPVGRPRRPAARACRLVGRVSTLGRMVAGRRPISGRAPCRRRVGVGKRCSGLAWAHHRQASGRSVAAPFIPLSLRRGV